MGWYNQAIKPIMKWQVLKKLKFQIKNSATDFLVAVSYLTIVPVPSLPFSENALQRALKYLGFVGAIVGIVSTIIFIGANYIFPLQIAICLSIVGTTILTGAFHEDGLSDFFDGFGGWYDKEKFLKIMKDSRIGSYGSLATIIVFTLKMLSLSNTPVHYIPLAMLLAHTTGRLVAISYFLTHTYVREKDNSYYKPMMKDRMSIQDFIFSLIPLIIIIAGIYWIGSAVLTYYLIPIILFKITYGALINKLIGGFTGDVLGAAEQLTEVITYLSILALIT